MAAPMTRVRRGDPTLNADIAMVGGANDQSASITIDPSERENNPLLEEEDENWDLPEDQRNKGGQPQQREQRETTQQHEGDPEPEEDVRLAYDEDEEEENIRGGRRARRNRSRRGAIDQRDQIIQQLAGELQQQRQLLQGLYGGQVTLSTRDVDQRIQFHQAALERADIELARAVKEADGDAFAIITKERDKVYRDLFGLQQMRTQLDERAREMEQQAPPPGQRQQGQQPPPEVQQAMAEQNSEFERMRDIFLDRYTWFDPDKGDDADHRMVKRIDAEVTNDGYQRHTKAFWHEMERRMQQEGFRPEGRRGRDEQDDDPLPAPRRVNGHTNGGGTRRSMPPTGSGRSLRRPGNGAGGYPLSDIQQDMLRDEGLLESNLSEADIAKRDRIIDKWKRGAAALRGR